jgi:cob(I)alamin adenosyltransferase
VKIYTRKGDEGSTNLFGGKSVSKSSLRIAAYGDVDELIAVLGVVCGAQDNDETGDLLRRLQSELHLVCADLANPNLKKPAKRTRAKHVKALEKQCDQYQDKLPPLTKFILPGGTSAGAHMHLARTVARRAERRIVALSQEEEINPEVLRYVNRLSDFLFLVARWINHQAGVNEHHPDYR